MYIQHSYNKFCSRSNTRITINAFSEKNLKPSAVMLLALKGNRNEMVGKMAWA
ncbi:MAG: hypothetical protein GQF41_1034 [Candidatus Rifleibacterium amylolyticum]|nr:MAG: hypothetical protein GQF41_1034 [Candidatus Rifleibacterium amylolyticum]